eukprot:301666-Amphidinium_carterae.1
MTKAQNFAHQSPVYPMCTTTLELIDLSKGWRYGEVPGSSAARDARLETVLCIASAQQSTAKLSAKLPSTKCLQHSATCCMN